MVKLLKIFNIWDMFFKQDILKDISTRAKLADFVSNIFLKLTVMRL